MKCFQNHYLPFGTQLAQLETSKIGSVSKDLFVFFFTKNELLCTHVAIPIISRTVIFQHAESQILISSFMYFSDNSYFKIFKLSFISIISMYPTPTVSPTVLLELFKVGFYFLLVL